MPRAVAVVQVVVAEVAPVEVQVVADDELEYPNPSRDSGPQHQPSTGRVQLPPTTGSVCVKCRQLRMYWTATPPVKWCAVCKYHRLCQRRSTLTGYFTTSLQLIKRRDPTTDLTLADLLALWRRQRGRCAFTDIPMTHSYHNPLKFIEHSFTNASVDRLDSTRGYTLPNVHLICQRVNLMKSNLPNRLFVWTCARVAANTRPILVQPALTADEIQGYEPLGLAPTPATIDAWSADTYQNSEHSSEARRINPIVREEKMTRDAMR